jgi:hypothetical protein
MVGMDELWQALLALSTIIISIGLAWLMLEWQGRSDRRRNTDKQERKET